MSPRLPPPAPRHTSHASEQSGADNGGGGCYHFSHPLFLYPSLSPSFSSSLSPLLYLMKSCLPVRLQSPGLFDTQSPSPPLQSLSIRASLANRSRQRGPVSCRLCVITRSVAAVLFQERGLRQKVSVSLYTHKTLLPSR